VLRWIQSHQFLDAYAKALTWVVRFFGVMCGVGGLMTLVVSVVTPDTSPWMYALVLLLAGICVGTFVAKPISRAQLGPISRDAMGASKVSDLRQGQQKAARGHNGSLGSQEPSLPSPNISLQADRER
jgi:hypothetical protein